MIQAWNQKSKALLVALFTFILLVATGCSATSTTEKEVTKKEKKEVIVQTLVEEDVVYASFKDAVKYMDGKYEVDGDAITATIKKDTIKANAKKKEATVNETNVQMEVAPKVKDDEVYVPISFLNEVLDARVMYEEEAKKVSIQTELPLEFTEAFRVTYLKGGLKKVVDAEKRTLILVPEGKEVPKEYAKETVITIPVKNTLLGSTTQASLLRPMGDFSSITSVTTKADQWNIEEIKTGLENGSIAYVGENNAPDYEAITKLQPELTFLYTGPTGLQDMAKKLDELNLNYAVDNEYLEEDPFGRMEWMKFLATFYDKEDEVSVYFDEAVKRVEDMEKKIEGKKKPKVAWGIVYDGEAYVPAADSYVATMIERAGGEYLFQDVKTDNGKISIEEFYAQSKDADVLIYSSMHSYSPTLESIVEATPILEKLDVVKEKNVWCFHPDYWQSIDKTDELIIDLVEIFHPGTTNEEVKHYIHYTE